MNHDEREVALAQMRKAVSQFYFAAAAIGNHPFIEFAGVMTEYVKACQDAHEKGIDFSECNTHSQHPLPMAAFRLDYLAEKLDCIFTGRIQVAEKPAVSAPG